MPRRLLRSPAGRRRGRQHLEAAAGPAVLPLGLLPPHVSEGTHSTVELAHETVEIGLVKFESSFDPSTGQWNMVAPMITARIRHGVAAANGKLYAVGGMDEDAFELRSVECFDSSTEQWSAVADMSTTRVDHDVAAVDDKLYAIGGYDNTGTDLSSMECFDPSTGQWSGVADMSTTRYGHGVAALECPQD